LFQLFSAILTFQKSEILNIENTQTQTIKAHKVEKITLFFIDFIHHINLFADKSVFTLFTYSALPGNGSFSKTSCFKEFSVHVKAELFKSIISSSSAFIRFSSAVGIFSSCNDITLFSFIFSSGVSIISLVSVIISSTGEIFIISSVESIISGLVFSDSIELVIELLALFSSSSSKRLNSLPISKFGKNSFHVEFTISSSFSSFSC